MKQWQTMRWLLPTLLMILVVVAACTGIANDQPANTLATPVALPDATTPGAEKDATQSGTPDLLVVVVTPTPAEDGETADAADEGVNTSEAVDSGESAASEEGAPNESSATPAATDEAAGEADSAAGAEGGQAEVAPAALVMNETELLSMGEQVYTQQ